MRSITTRTHFFPVKTSGVINQVIEHGSTDYLLNRTRQLFSTATVQDIFLSAKQAQTKTQSQTQTQIQVYIQTRIYV